MELLMISLLMILNFGISWYNAYVTGKSWVESKAVGGWIWLVCVSGAIMSAIGFSSVYMFLIAILAVTTGYMEPSAVQAMTSLWYILIIIPALSTGLIITIESWRVALREKSLMNMGVAGFNTLAQAYNMYQAFTGIGDAFSKVGEFFSDSDSNGRAIMAVLLLVAISLLGGVLTTAVLIRKYAASVALPKEVEYKMQFAAR